jgi:hypothetical protein
VTQRKPESARVTAHQHPQQCQPFQYAMQMGP